MKNIKKIVLTGGPFSGKSTLISELESLGYPIAQEAALLVIAYLNETLGVAAQIEFRNSNIDKIQEMIYEKQVQLENHAVSLAIKHHFNFIICDRGVYDGLSYYKLFGKPANKSLIKKIEQHTYDNVFVCEVLPNFDARSDTGRFEDLEASKKLSNYSYDIYSKVTPNVLWLPVMSIEERLNFILDSID
jgi:predicted ATPase